MRMQSICHPGEVVNIASVGQGIHGKTLDATDPPRRAVGVRAGWPWALGLSRYGEYRGDRSTADPAIDRCSSRGLGFRSCHGWASVLWFFTAFRRRIFDGKTVG